MNKTLLAGILAAGIAVGASSSVVSADGPTLRLTFEEEHPIRVLQVEVGEPVYDVISKTGNFDCGQGSCVLGPAGGVTGRITEVVFDPVDPTYP